LNLDYRISNTISARISAEHVKAHGRYNFQYSNMVYDTTAVRRNADIRSNRLEASLYGRPKKQISWNVKYYHYNSERGLPGAIVANVFNRPQRLWDRNNFLQANYNQE